MSSRRRQRSTNGRQYALHWARSPRAALAALLLLSACSSIRIPWVGDWSSKGPGIEMIAVMPVERSPAPSEKEGGGVEPEAEAVVTAAIYGALSDTYEWRFVPDLTVADAMRNIDVLDDARDQARDLGKAVEADGVLFGSVWRYVDRIGNDREVERAASVAFELRLLSVSTGEVIWEQSYDRTQTSSRASLMDWLPFWESGPAWLTAAELTHEGVNGLTQELRRALN